MSVLSDTFAGAALPEISNSLRFDGTNDYLTRTPSVAGNRKTWTLSGWVKRGTIGILQELWFTGSSSTYFNQCYFDTNNTLVWFERVSGGTGSGGLFTSTAVFRDPAAWYHFVFVWDTTQVAQADRMKFYVNNELQPVTWTTYPGLNYDGWFNNTLAHYVASNTGASQYFDGYLSNVCFIDGQALTPSSFAYTDPNGQWRSLPKATLTSLASAGGTNSFFLPFDNGSSTTTLGADASSKANNWTLTNMVRDGSTSDCWSYDTPTNNFATANVLDNQSGNTVTNGALNVSTPSATGSLISSTQRVISGKWYFETTIGTTGGSSAILGVCTSGNTAFNQTGVYAYVLDGTKYQGGVGASAYGSTYTFGDVIGVALDVSSGKIWFSKNGTWQASGDPAAGTNAAFTGLSGEFAFALMDASSSGGTVYDANFGQRPVASGQWYSDAGGYFRYAPPAGFKALCRKNLESSLSVAAREPQKHFTAVIYAGDGTTGRSITTDGRGNSIALSPDFVWIKGRTANNTNNALYDRVRGSQQYIFSNSTNAEGTNTGSNGLTAFGSNGFTVGDDANGTHNVNGSGGTYGGNYAAWLWKANGAAVTNTAGSITSQVSANTAAGFSIVTYTGTGANATVGHGLGVAPKMVIVKDRDSGSNGGAVYHYDRGSTKYLKLFQTTTGTDAEATDNTVWNGGSPTFNQNVFSVGTSARTNSTNKMVAYCFAEVPGFSKFGSYTGNGSPDGPFVWCGFRPRWVLMKRSSDVGGDWHVFDSTRSATNVATVELFPNSSSAEGVAPIGIDLVANGFKIRDNWAGINNSASTFIFIAFAEAPFPYANAR